MWPIAPRLANMGPIRYGGLQFLPSSRSVSWTDRSNHDWPLPAPSLFEGKSTGPPEAARFLPLAVEAGFPPLLEVSVFLPQLEVGWSVPG